MREKTDEDQWYVFNEKGKFFTFHFCKKGNEKEAWYHKVEIINNKTTCIHCKKVMSEEENKDIDKAMEKFKNKIGSDGNKSDNTKIEV